MKNEVKAVALTQTKARIDADLMGIVGAVTLGLFLLFAAGFAQATVMHDTAHDTRHAMAFPCH
jgi:cobalt transporter subunit CbtB